MTPEFPRIRRVSHFAAMMESTPLSMWMVLVLASRVPVTVTFFAGELFGRRLVAQRVDFLAVIQNIQSAVRHGRRRRCIRRPSVPFACLRMIALGHMLSVMMPVNFCLPCASVSAAMAASAIRLKASDLINHSFSLGGPA